MLLRFLSINTLPTSPGSFQCSHGRLRSRQSRNVEKFMIIVELIGAVLVADFLSGLFHWLEDAYGREDWPITGRLVTKPNILHQ